MVYLPQAVSSLNTTVCSKCNYRRLSTSWPLYKKKSSIQKQPRASYDVVTIPGEKKDISLALPKQYSSQFTEAAWYDWWVKQGYFQPSPAKEKFVMILPPPNVTGRLHIGHAFTGAVQDALVRWNRMRGLSTLWLPGLDHAGIATQVVVEKQLWREERLTRHDVGKEAFLKLVWDWKEKRAEEINSQLKRMGLSLDWSRATFTMDDNIKKAVTHAFCELYNQGLISRSTRIVNWSCQLKSAIADIEVDITHIDGPTNICVPGYNREITLGYLTSFAYPIHNSNRSEEIVVATTRLETLLGDTAIAVHPEDERYKHLVGSSAVHPFSDRLIPIIADDFVQQDIGTGAVKITPSHSAVDHEVAERHSLDHINILNDDGTLCNCGELFDGMKRFDAREKVARLLQKKELWRGQEAHPMAVPICSRSSDVVEPRKKEQWFLDCSQMASDAIKVSDEGNLQFTPSYYSKLWAHTLNQTQEIPWCVSRQLWWGHAIPAYQLIDVDSNQFVKWIVAPSLTAATKEATALIGHNRFKLVQDGDVLDTWFSSALLPFASLGWPTQNASLSTFYPGSMIESGSDILFFWIARMVMLGQKLTNTLPFKEVLIHSLLLSQGKKMSKSKGNVIDPLSIIEGSTLTELEKALQSGNMDRKDMVEALAEQKMQFAEGIPECGADALRMALCSYNIKGQAVNIQVSTFIECRSLCNKIWQIFIFYQRQFAETFVASDVSQLSSLSYADQWILSRCASLVEDCAANFSSADLDVIVSKLRSFWTNDLSRLYLEWSKPLVLAGTENTRQQSLSVAAAVMEAALLCLSPFMPFLSEELYQRLPVANKSASVCIAPFPDPHQWARYRNQELEGEFGEMLAISSQINNFKQLFGVLHQSKTVGTVHLMNDVKLPISEGVLHYIQRYCRLDCLHVDTEPADMSQVCQLNLAETTCKVFVDIGAELQSKAVEELERMGMQLHKLLTSERKILDKIVHLDMNELCEEELREHQAKVESLKKEVARAEMCVDYLIRAGSAPSSGDDSDD